MFVREPGTFLYNSVLFYVCLICKFCVFTYIYNVIILGQKCWSVKKNIIKRLKKPLVYLNITFYVNVVYF